MKKILAKLKKTIKNNYAKLILLFSFACSFLFNKYLYSFNLFTNILSQKFYYTTIYEKVSIQFSNITGHVKLFFLSISIWFDHPVNETGQFVSSVKNINIEPNQYINLFINVIMIVCLSIYIKYSNHQSKLSKSKPLKRYEFIKSKVKLIIDKTNKLIDLLQKHKKLIAISILVLLTPYLIIILYYLLHYLLYYLVYLVLAPNLYSKHLIGGLFTCIYLIERAYMILPLFLKIIVILTIVYLILLIYIKKDKKHVNKENTKRFKEEPYNQPIGIYSGGTDTGKTTQITYTADKLEEQFLLEINEKLVLFESQLDENKCMQLVKLLNDNEEIEYLKEDGSPVKTNILKVFMNALRTRLIMKGLDSSSVNYEMYLKKSNAAISIIKQTELSFILDNTKYFDYLEYYYYAELRGPCIITSYPIKDDLFKGQKTRILNIDQLDMTDSKTWNCFEAYSIIVVDEASKSLGMASSTSDDLFYKLHLDVLVSMFSQISGRTGKMFFIDQKLNDINRTARSNAGFMIQIETKVEVYKSIVLSAFLGPIEIVRKLLLAFINYATRTKEYKTKYSSMYRYRITNYKQYLSLHLAFSLYRLLVRYLAFMINNYGFLRYKKLKGVRESVDKKESVDTMKKLKIPICDISDKNLKSIFDTSYSRNFYEKNALISDIPQWSSTTPTRTEIISTGLYGRMIFNEDEDTKKKKKGAKK